MPDPYVPELKFRRVTTEDDLVTFGVINTQAYGMPPDAGPAALSGSMVRLDSYAYGDSRKVTLRRQWPCVLATGGVGNVARADRVPGDCYWLRPPFLSPMGESGCVMAQPVTARRLSQDEGR